MIRNADFFATDKDSAILNHNFGFLEREGELAFEQAQRWVSILDVTPTPATEAIVQVENVNEDPIARIIKLDADRTFASDQNRQVLIRVLTRVHKQLGDYAQALALIGGVLLLTLDEDTVVAILLKLAQDPKYLPMYFKSESVAFGTDALVYNSMVEKRFPAVSAQLKSKYIVPETYCQKWFTALCVHVLPFELLFKHFENFFRFGYVYSFQFSLAVLSVLGDRIASTKEIPKLFELLRLDAKTVSRDTLSAIVEAAVDVDVSEFDIPALRAEFMPIIQKRIDDARAALAEEDDEEEEDWDDDEEDDE
eukprot:GILI01009141.1.p1 GENE.GILI01009141.1~~GILI01009141.1.p1  ORF type:complete len:327 (+),score=117.60 GILI01009141.1:60-983(+)